MSTSSRRGGHQTLIGSSISRAIDALFRQPIQWVAVLRLVFGTALALVLAYSINVSGGFVTVLGVLFIPFMPHNPLLGLGRLLAGAVACGGGWLVAYQFVEQPWLLVPLVSMNAFLFFYLLARGLPLMSMLILGLFPIAIAWMLMVGRTGSDVVTLFLELLGDSRVLVEFALPHRLETVRTSVPGVRAASGSAPPPTYSGSGVAEQS